MQLNSFLSSLLQPITQQDSRAIKPLLLTCSSRSVVSNRLHLINNGEEFCFWQVECNRLHFG